MAEAGGDAGSSQEQELVSSSLSLYTADKHLSCCCFGTDYSMNYCTDGDEADFDY